MTCTATTRRTDLVDPYTFCTLDYLTAVRVPTAALRPGDLLIDDLGLPCAYLLARLGTRPGGLVEWLGVDLDGNGAEFTATFPASLAPVVTVAADVRWPV